MLAVAGIYGVMTYIVTQRRREIGVRVALGAQKRQVLGIILGEGLTTTGVGIALGIIAALALTRTIESLLFGVTPSDPLTFVIITALLLVTAVLAAWLPARRAARIDPLISLRSE